MTECLAQELLRHPHILQHRIELYDELLLGHPSVGVPQAESGEFRLDLSSKDWYVFNENYGTSEEKAFVKYFNQQYSRLRENYDEIYLV